MSSHTLKGSRYITFNSKESFAIKGKGTLYMVDFLKTKPPIKGEKIRIDGSVQVVEKVDIIKCMCREECGKHGSILVKQKK